MPAGYGDVTRLMIDRDGRTTINLRAEGNDALTEAERDIASRARPRPRRRATPAP